MPTCLVTQPIAASPDAIWPVLADVVHWPDWTPTVVRVDPLGPAQIAAGARFRVLQPKLRPAVWTVTDVQPPRSFTWEARSPGLLMVAGHTLVERGPGTTALELRFEFRGVLGAVVGRLARSRVLEYLGTEAAQLRARVERRRDGPG